MNGLQILQRNKAAFIAKDELSLRIYFEKYCVSLRMSSNVQGLCLFVTLLNGHHVIKNNLKWLISIMCFVKHVYLGGKGPLVAH